MGTPEVRTRGWSGEASARSHVARTRTGAHQTGPVGDDDEYPEQGAAPTVLSLLACGLGIVSAMTFLAIPAPEALRSTRLAAALVGGGTLVLLAIELLTIGTSRGGPDIGQGLVRLIAIVTLLAGVLVGRDARGRPELTAGGGGTASAP